jgi:DNA integrity scanning protein DisA with diadenylate cyclase activity
MTAYSENERAWLSKFDSQQLDMMNPVTPIQANEALTDEKVTAHIAAYSIEQISAICPENVKIQLNDLISTNAAQRKVLIDHITNNTEKNTWAEKDLEGMETSMLKKVASTIRVNGQNIPVDYTGAAAGNDAGGANVQVNSDVDDEPMMPVSYKSSKKGE